MVTYKLRLISCFLSIGMLRADTVLVEAESLADIGGWTLDTQFIELMGSPYLLAHGLGKAVKDAQGTFRVAEAGTYTVWARTKDWVAKWQAPGAPGKFKIKINGQALSETLGTQGAQWHFQKAGTVTLSAGEHLLALTDLTGFNGRCDAVVLSNAEGFSPPEETTALAEFRRKALKLPESAPESPEYDLVVVGGGYSGLGAAISAARMGIKVALLQNRPVLGGNGSSEIRVWAQGGTRRGLFPHLGEIVEEIADFAKDSPGTYEEYGDAQKERVVRAEPNLSLFLNTHVLRAEMAPGADRQIRAVMALDTRTSRETQFRGKFFVDATGHGTLGALAGAQHHLQEKDHMGMSNMWMYEDGPEPSTFSAAPWALDLTLDDFPSTRKSSGSIPFWKGEWFWESGFNLHPLTDLELTRDWNLRAVFGAFHALKNGSEAAKHEKARLSWVAAIGGTRESRMLEGDVRLSEQDIVSGKIYPDACVPTTWDIDLHYAKEQYAKKFPENPFISRAAFGKGVDKSKGYPLPYRAFYSKNVPNLFMAGRCISVTHEALGTVRVMRTCGMMGEVVGKAASICVAKSTTPRGVYEQHWNELKSLMELPGAARRTTVTAAIELPKVPTVFPPSAGDKYRSEVGKNIGIKLEKLKGVVADDEKAKLEGTWSHGAGLEGYVEAGYHYASKDSAAKATYTLTVPKSGKYEVFASWQPHENRASNARFEIQSAAGAKEVTVNQRAAAGGADGFGTLGIYEFRVDQPAVVILHAKGSDGHVHADAILMQERK
jgi:hypothetical protein